MNAQFHTPSFGDEVFAVTDLDSNTSSNFEHHQQQQQSKRMRGSMDSSLDEYHTANDESFVGNNSAGRMASPTPTATATVASRKQLTPSSDQSEPAKPLSAYALFFRDTVSAIKQQNPNCTFQEISRIVASMWEALDPTHKNLYNKKNENAKNEYIRQMRSHRQQQLEQQQQQQQQQQHLTHMNSVTHPMQSKPAVFTISRTNSESDVHPFNNSAINTHQNMNSPQQQIQTQYQQQQQVHLYQQQYEFQQQPNFNHQQSQLQQHPHPQDQQQEEQQQQQQITANCIDASPPPAQQIQLLTEAGSVQKCIREHCTKRAIINPDWEDEYCSNECVVIHCRNVFNEWVESNLEARAQ